ncbi:MAG: hypothetical protein RH949_27345, partial [Coleofasciculus sp. A1-SPW-01]
MFTTTPETHEDIYIDELVEIYSCGINRKGDSNGQRSGKPRFKARNRYRTLTYPQMKDGCWQGNLINLPMFGQV